MSQPFGLSAQGLLIKSLNDIVSSMSTSIQSDLGTNIDLSDGGPLGNVVGVIAGELSELWQQIEGVYLSQYPDTAEGQSLDNCRSLNNIPRKGPEVSEVVETITAAAGTVIPGTDTSGTPFQMSVAGSNHTIVFQATQTVTIPSGGSANVNMACTQDGPFAAPAGSLTVIETPIAGVVSGTNSADAILGALLETDPAYRLRSAQELQRSDAGTVEGIRSTLLDTVDVTQAVVIENIEDVVDGNGNLPHSFEPFAEGGTNANVAESVWQSKPAGIAMDGNVSQSITDSMGNAHTILFARPTLVPLYFIVNITLDTDPEDGAAYPPDGDTQVKNALLNYVAGFAVGQNGVNPSFVSVIMQSVTGILDLQVLVGTSPGPITSNPVLASFDELFTLDISNVTVNS